MSPPGGSRIGHASGREIVQKMFEGDDKQKLEQAQRTAQIQEQGRVQEASREGTREARDEQAEQTKRDRTESQERRGPDREARTSQKSRSQEQMDGFLKRTSSQQRTREAGREYNQERQMRSHTPQSWSVYNSRQTSSQARRMIQARQQSTRQGQSAKPQTSTPQSRSSLPTTRTAQRTWTPSTPLNIRYGRQQGSEGQPQARLPFAGRFSATRTLTQQMQRFLVTQQGAQTAQSQTGKPVVLVHLRGSLVFVRDQGKTRAFKLEKDGSLSELPTDDASDQPLSPEAKAQLQKVLRQKGVKSHLDQASSGETEHVTDAELAAILKEQKDAEGKEGELDLDTRFALLLYEALEEKKKVGKGLKEGEDPDFPTKADWMAFFAKLGKLGNQEQESSKSLEEILGLIFRGLFNKKGKGQYLVGDLKYQRGAREGQEKFAQVAIQNEAFLKFLQQLKPGQSISADKLAQIFGEELTYLLMRHAGEETLPMSTGAEKNVVYNPKASVDLYSQARLEAALFATRLGKGEKTPGTEAGPERFPPPAPTGVFANVYELLGLRRRFEENPKLYTWVAYMGMGAAVGGTLYYVISTFLG